jgi:hypothetical protein
MSTRAIVVGCHAHPATAGADTCGVTADALAFREWLLDGGVRQADLRFLAGRRAATPRPPSSGRRRDVTIDGAGDLDSFTREVGDAVTHHKADRLYVFMAGHGYRTSPENRYLGQHAIAFPDVSNAGRQVVAIAVDAVLQELARGQFGAILLVVDAFRDIPTGDSRTGDVPTADVPTAERMSLDPFGANHSRLGPGTPKQFHLQAAVEDDVDAGSSIGNPHSRTRPTHAGGAALTAALLGGLAGKAESQFDGADDGGAARIVRWSSLERYLCSALPNQPPFMAGQDGSLVMARISDTRPGEAAKVTVRARGSDDVGEFRVRSSDPNVMLTVEDSAGLRRAVGIGSIEGSLPAGRYTAVLADPAAADPRTTFDVTSGRVSDVALQPVGRWDGFRATEIDELRFSSPAAQLAAATQGVWAYGHRSYLLVGGTSDVPPPERVIAGYPQRFEYAGALSRLDDGWWVAIPVRGPWRSIQLGGHRITVPAAPDSVSSVALTATTTTVALFDTTHADPAHVAAQDRVQEYLAVDHLGAADLTSRGSIEAGQRWPWGATAAIRRLIDRTRSVRAGEDVVTRSTSGVAMNGASNGAAPIGGGSMAARAGPAGDTVESEDPPHQFVSDVPPDQRHRLVGRGPWAVWLDWP